MAMVLVALPPPQLSVVFSIFDVGADGAGERVDNDHVKRTSEWMNRGQRTNDWLTYEKSGTDDARAVLNGA